MNKYSSILLLLLVLITAVLAAFDIAMEKQNRRLQARLGDLSEKDKIMNSPLPGWTMPILRGRKIDGREGGVDLQRSAPKMAVVVFKPEDCNVCDETMARLDGLLSDSNVGSSFILLTASTTVPSTYRTQHHLQEIYILTNVAREILAPMQMELAPQVIYVERGTVKKSWLGPLSEADVTEIRDVLAN